MTDRRNISPDIQSALDACRLAWTQHPEATYGWNIHHEEQLERLTEPIETRIQYILAFKPEEELITRFNNMRPVVSKLSDTAYDTFIKARNAYYEASYAYQGADYAFIKARDAYDEARDAFHEADYAYSEASDAYDTARNAFHEASDAYSEASDAYRKALDAYTPKHLIDVPHTTWNGLSIFPMKDL